MTPELKNACEVVFQEHKASQYPVTWNRDAFRGRISTGLSEMAKDTLLRKNIIYYPNPAKKVITILNPGVAAANTVEEAEKMIVTKVPSLSSSLVDNSRTHAANPVSSFVSRPATHRTHHRLITMTGETGTIAEIKWYMKPLFLYVIWPVCAAVLGGVIAYFMGSVYTGLFFDLKK